VAVGVRIEDGIFRQVRVVVGAAHPQPMRLRPAEEELLGARVGAELASGVAIRAVAALRPAGDVQGSADYRRHVAAVLLRRAILRAAERSSQ
jgi:carbon-monoxide dehydrogenase medium subunit